MFRPSRICARILRRLASLAIGCGILLISHSNFALAVDTDCLTQASLDCECLSPDKNTIDLLIETSTTAFNEDSLKSYVATHDGYRMRVKLDNDGRAIGHEILPVLSGNGSFGHPMFAGNQTDTYVFVRDDGNLRRFLRKNERNFTWQDFDELTKTWGRESATQAMPLVPFGNLRTEGNRWKCVERGKLPDGVSLYDAEAFQMVKDDWLDRTLTTSLKRATFSLGNGIRVSNQKNFVVCYQQRNDVQEFILYGRRMTGPIAFHTVFRPPFGTYLRAVNESRDGSAAIIFSLDPDIVYAYEIDPQIVDQRIDLKDVKQIRSKAMCDAAYNVWYHADIRSIVGVSADFSIVTPSPTFKFKAQARVVRWNLESGQLSEIVIPYGEQFHVVGKRVVPKTP